MNEAFRQELLKTLRAAGQAMADERDAAKVALRRYDREERDRHDANFFNVKFHLETLAQVIGDDAKAAKPPHTCADGLCGHATESVLSAPRDPERC